MRLNGVENEPLGIVSIMEALRLAGEADVDLVEIAATASPPMCRLMDYGKFKYQEQKKAAEAKSKQKVIDVKEVKFRPGADDADYNVKMRNLRRFIPEDGDKGKVTGVKCARVNPKRDPLPGTEFIIRADLVLIAIGFAGPEEKGLLEETAFERDGRSNIKANTDDYKTSVEKVFAAGDIRKGQSLVVWAIREGRQAARAIDEYLMGESELPR